MQPICLPGPNKVFNETDQCRITGWGSSKKSGYRKAELHEGTVKLVSKTICNSPKSYDGNIHSRIICAGYADGRVDACTYDSGGKKISNGIGLNKQKF